MDSEGFDRRKFLKGAASVLATGSGLGLLGSQRLRSKHDIYKYSGVPEKFLDDPEFYDRLTQYSPETEVERFEPGERNMILDYHVVGDFSRLDHITNVVEHDFEQMGINVTSLQSPRNYQRDWFLENYGLEQNEIVGGGKGVFNALISKNDSFWAEQTDEVLKEAAIQVIYIEEPEDYPDGVGLTDHTGSGSYGGVSIGDRTAVFVNSISDYGDYESFFNSTINVTEHEIAHSLGLDHEEGTIMNPSLGSKRRDFDQRQVEKILDSF